MAAEATVAPLVVDYCPVTGAPAEFNDFLPKDSDEYKKWKAFTEGQLEGTASRSHQQQHLTAATGKTAELSLKDAQTSVAEKKQSGKAKKKVAQEVLITRAVRNKKKCVTTVAGLEHFGVKLGEAAKVFGKKFASGASVTKTATGGEEIDIQVWVSTRDTRASRCAAGRCAGCVARPADQDVWGEKQHREEAHFHPR